MSNLLVNRQFQVFFFGLAFLGAIAGLMAAGTIDSTTGLPLLTTVGGFTLGVPVTAPSSVTTTTPAKGTSPPA